MDIEIGDKVKLIDRPGTGIVLAKNGSIVSVGWRDKNGYTHGSHHHFSRLVVVKEESC